MATQQEINQQLGVWAANFLLLMTKKGFFEGRTSTNLDTWFNRYIKPLYTQLGTSDISLPTTSETQDCKKNDPKYHPSAGRTTIVKARSSVYGDQLIALFKANRSNLAGILNSLSISNAVTILAEFDKIALSLNRDVGCKGVNK